ncbi:MAG: hypothetical protein CUN51_02890 [Candidatus Thermofonsia Clade 1 bacterium]|uniref:Uncharacterized protein n=1 Tax=Candidatus Thermofonsia Clade 1 bacterium TaxID=2364210 RepID=A0A2M8P2X9_9CHLR|nr:MAG: hypothetical protein CUN51_02890 [Candidatus Thermofonsia Clade 1 bacterium]
MKSLRLIVFFVSAAALIAPVMALQAVSGSGNLQVGCTGFIDLGSTFTADRDNTGMGTEAYRFVATDGAGNQIHFFANAVPVGFSGSVGSSSWSGAPQYNPITLRFISDAGNGFQEQLVAQWTGECPGLPTFFGGPGLPENKNLVLFLSDVPILSDANGSPTGLVMKACQTAFVIGERNGFARLFMMGGWVPVSSYVDVPEDYGQKSSPVVPQCVGK